MSTSSSAHVYNTTLTRSFAERGGCARIESRGKLNAYNSTVSECESVQDGAGVLVSSGYVDSAE